MTALETYTKPINPNHYGPTYGVVDFGNIEIFQFWEDSIWWAIDTITDKVLTTEYTKEAAIKYVAGFLREERMI